ncbi:MAG: hypothetical protein ACD_76C00020G0005, partial [uncultured bacterium]
MVYKNKKEVQIIIICYSCFFNSLHADVAELVYALASEASESNLLEVQILSSALSGFPPPTAGNHA